MEKQLQCKPCLPSGLSAGSRELASPQWLFVAALPVLPAAAAASRHVWASATPRRAVGRGAGAGEEVAERSLSRGRC